MNKKIENMFENLFPSSIRCEICETHYLNNNETIICDDCLEKLLSSKSICYFKYVYDNKSLSLIRTKNLSDGKIICIYPYNSIMQLLIKKLKFDYQIKLADFIADNISYIIAQIEFDKIVPLTSSNFSMKERGFNHIEIITDKLGRILNKPVDNCLIRTKNVVHQLGLTKSKRLLNVKNTFQCNKNLKGQKILLLDDVITSGASTYYASEALKDAGAFVTVCGICRA